MNLEELGNRLYELRKKHHYSQEELADKIDVSRQAISRWERGEVAPDTENLICLSELYGISLDELIHGNVEKAPQEKIELKENENKSHEKKNIGDVVNFIAIFVIVICYLLAGSLTKLWHPLWIMLLAIPVIFSITETIRTKDMGHFLYPVVVVMIYITIGFVWGIWHPSWVVFLTIPVYYFLCSFIAQLIRKK